MVSVAEDDLRAHLTQLPRVEGLDAGLGADRHEHRSVDDAMGRREPPEPGTGLSIRPNQFKHGKELAAGGGGSMQ
jgi:hypothetical protein